MHVDDAVAMSRPCASKTSASPNSSDCLISTTRPTARSVPATTGRRKLIFSSIVVFQARSSCSVASDMPIAASAIWVITPPWTTPAPWRCCGPASISTTTRPGSASAIRAPSVCIQPFRSSRPPPMSRATRAAFLKPWLWTSPGAAPVADHRLLLRRGGDREGDVGVFLLHGAVLAGKPLAHEDDAVADPRGILELQLLGQPPHLLLQVAHDREQVFARNAGSGHQLDRVRLQVLLVDLERVDR